jgi:hypothetical protein
MTSDNSVGARQPSDCTTVGDWFLRQVLIARCCVMMCRRAVFSVRGWYRGYLTIRHTAYEQCNDMRTQDVKDLTCDVKTLSELSESQYCSV